MRKILGLLGELVLVATLAAVLPLFIFYGPLIGSQVGYAALALAVLAVQAIGAILVPVLIGIGAMAIVGWGVAVLNHLERIERK